jgi:hypothetical protein
MTRKIKKKADLQSMKLELLLQRRVGYRKEKGTVLVHTDGRKEMRRKEKA